MRYYLVELLDGNRGYATLAIGGVIMSANGPEWDVYDAYRTAALNVCYAERQIKKLSRRNFCIEAAITATATGVV